MENPEEILHSLEEFSKMKPKDIPRELEEYLCFVAKTGNPIYQWPIIKSLFREKLINVITEFYESCPSMDIPPCPNVEMFNYDMMKNFILEKLDTFAAAPFTVQRICELLTTPRKEYSRIDKYMRALEKNILVVSTVEPGRRSTENGEESIMNGVESEHLPESSNSSHDINIEDMDESPSNWTKQDQVMPVSYKNVETENVSKNGLEPVSDISTNFESDDSKTEKPSSSTIKEPKRPQETVITCTSTEETIETYVSIEPQETSYQNLSEESNSNSSDSSSSASTSETKELVSSEEKEINEETSEVKEDTIVPKENEEIQKPVDVPESQPEPVVPLNEESQFEISHSEPSNLDIPNSESSNFEISQTKSPIEAVSEKTIEDISITEDSPDVHQSDVTSVSETNSEAEEKIETEEKEVKQLPEKEEETIELKTVSEPATPIPQESENIVDSSTDINKELPKESHKEVTELDKVEVNDVETIINDVTENKEQYEESPMEVDINLDKKEEAEEPSSSVEPFVV